MSSFPGQTATVAPEPVAIVPMGHELSAYVSYAALTAATDNWAHRLGAGGFGEVFSGVLPGGERVAVKRALQLRLPGGAGGGGPSLDAFAREVDAAAAVGRHPCVLPLLALSVPLPGMAAGDKAPHPVCLVSPLMSGGSLHDRLAAGPVPLTARERCDVLTGLAAALAALHSRGVVHRDVKTPNLLLDRSHGVALADLGLARVLDTSQGHVTTAWGGGFTPGYACPDAQDTGRVGSRVDVYGLGVVILECLTGCPAVSGSSGAPAPGGDAISPPVWDPAIPLLSGRVLAALARGAEASTFADPTAEWTPAAATDLAALAKRCLRRQGYGASGVDPEPRPSAAEALAELRSIRGTHLPGGMGWPLPTGLLQSPEGGTGFGNTAVTVPLATCCVCGEQRPQGIWCDGGNGHGGPGVEPSITPASVTPMLVTNEAFTHDHKPPSVVDAPPSAAARHFICGGAGSCLASYVSSRAMPGALNGVDSTGRLSCPGRGDGPGAPPCPRPLSAFAVAGQVGEAAFGAHCAAVVRHASREARHDERAAATGELEAARAALRASQADVASRGGLGAAEALSAAEVIARHVQNEILTLKGPCGHPFLDFDFEDCFCLSCATCGKQFCGWCLVGGFGSSAAAHSHVGICASNPQPAHPATGVKSIYGTRDQFVSAHRLRRASAVAAYVAATAGSDTVGAVVKKLLVRDLADHGIDVHLQLESRKVPIVVTVSPSAQQLRAKGEAEAAGWDALCLRDRDMDDAGKVTARAFQLSYDFGHTICQIFRNKLDNVRDEEFTIYHDVGCCVQTNPGPSSRELMGQMLGSALRKNTSVIFFKFPHINDDGIQDYVDRRRVFIPVALALRNNNVLATLNLLRCMLDNASAAILAVMLRTNTGIRVLDLTINYIGIDGLELLAEAVLSNVASKLMTLKMNSNRVNELDWYKLRECNIGYQAVRFVVFS